MKKLTLILALTASPAMAAPTDKFFTMQNPFFVIWIGFLLFIALLTYLKVPGLISGMLDKRADGIRSDLDEARALREDAQSILASYERKKKEVGEQADRIVAHAKQEAEIVAAQAQEDLKASITRRLAAAEDQIQSAQDAAVKEVRDSAVQVAVAAASDVIAKGMSAADGNKLIDAAIKDAEARLH